MTVTPSQSWGCCNPAPEKLARRGNRACLFIEVRSRSPSRSR